MPSLCLLCSLEIVLALELSDESIIRRQLRVCWETQGNRRCDAKLLGLSCCHFEHSLLLLGQPVTLARVAEVKAEGGAWGVDWTRQHQGWHGALLLSISNDSPDEYRSATDDGLESSSRFKQIKAAM